MLKKINYETVKASFEKEGYTLLTKTYENNRQKLEYICKMGHRHCVDWNHWNSKKKRRCPYCNGRPIITIEIVRQAMAKEGYILLTKVYKNSRQKLEYICPMGHHHSITWGHWNSKEKRRCPYCVNKGKLAIEHIRAKFAKEGYILLTKIYKNCYQKLEYICPRGHYHSITWSSWNSKKKPRCPYCVNRGKPTIEFIRADFAKKGYELLTKVYKNNYTKLEYICPRGHRHSVSWSNWKKGKRCPCFSNLMQPNIEYIRAEFAKEGYILLTLVYEDAHQKLKYICPMGHHHSITWSHWNSKDKRRCPYCVGNAKLNIEFIRAEFAKEGYELLTKVYENAKQKLEYVCPRGHRHFVTWDNWNSKAKQRCPKCNNNHVSKWEKEVKKFLGKSNIDYVPNDRSQLVNPNTNYNLELDIWVPKLNKAIECNGFYWHSKPERKKCDKIKKQLCKDQGIDLLVITDKEWNDDIDKCKNKIQDFLLVCQFISTKEIKKGNGNKK